MIILFLVQGIIFSGMYPLWEGFDVFAHFGYVQHVVENKSLPIFDDPLSNEIVDTFDKTPMSNMLAWVSEFLKTEFIYYQHSTYWENFNLEEIQKNREFISSQPFESRIQSHTLIPIYEAQQPPLSYLVQVPIYLMFYDQDILTRVFALRIFSVLVTAAAIVIAYKTISLLFDDRLIRLGSLMFIVFNPMFTTNIARVNNEFMTIFLFSAFLYLVVRYLKEKTNLKYCLFIGVVLGLGLLTKSTFLPALLLVPLFIFLKHIQKNTKESQIRGLSIDFGAAGIWIRQNSSSWVKLL